MDEIDDAQRDHRQRQNKQETPILGRESALITCFGSLQTDSILPPVSESTYNKRFISDASRPFKENTITGVTHIRGPGHVKHVAKGGSCVGRDAAPFPLRREAGVRALP